MDKETSSRVSSIAGDLVNLTLAQLLTKMENNPDVLVSQIRTLAGSALSQDETPGQSTGKTDASGIHPAPSEFSDAQVAADPILHFFYYSHLPPVLQATSRMFFLLASHVISTVPRNAERTVALRKLLEAKDAAVRANLPAPKLSGQRELPIGERTVGETVEIGGHDLDRDGDPKFDG